MKKSSSDSNKKNASGIVNWEAEEYIQRDKNTGWYIGFAAVTLALVVVSVLLKWWTFTALVVLSAVAIMIYSMRPPRKIHYSLSSKGISEGNNLYNFEDFKSFGVLQDEKNFAIVLTPRKRFSPRVTIYFPEGKGEEIVDGFGGRLPMEEVRLDFLDKLVKFLRF